MPRTRTGSSGRPVIAGCLYTRVVDARILVVEDDPTVAEVVVDYLRNAGLEPGT